MSFPPWWQGPTYHGCCDLKFTYCAWHNYDGKAGRTPAILVAATVVLPNWSIRSHMEVRARATISTWRLKNRRMFHFKGDTIVAIRLLVQIKHTEINGCACTGDFRLLFSLWNQRRPRPKNLLLSWCSKRCMIVQYWFRKLVGVLCTAVCWKNTAIRVWKRDCGEKCARQSFVSEFSQLDFPEKRKG